MDTLWPGSWLAGVIVKIEKQIQSFYLKIQLLNNFLKHYQDMDILESPGPFILSLDSRVNVTECLPDLSPLIYMKEKLQHETWEQGFTNRVTNKFSRTKLLVEIGFNNWNQATNIGEPWKVIRKMYVMFEEPPAHMLNIFLCHSGKDDNITSRIRKQRSSPDFFLQSFTVFIVNLFSSNLITDSVGLDKSFNSIARFLLSVEFSLVHSCCNTN